MIQYDDGRFSPMMPATDASALLAALLPARGPVGTNPVAAYFGTPEQLQAKREEAALSDRLDALRDRLDALDPPPSVIVRPSPDYVARFTNPNPTDR